ncbi:class II glutamine amidotransferase [Reinekea sp. G2M2-21]|uniref:class II glutamine amidotransferase n=1 Tax=Reinekea sp. G2M2-21 TaxID=2788942 RepID=UPI0018AA2667|nr:class II glutamine amidotransferase [Reinekea sp. G2M2-21]
MCELFAVSARHPTSIQVSMSVFAEHGGLTGPHKDGWGIAYYQGNDAWLIKAPESAANSQTQALVRASAPLTTLALAHIRLATQGNVSLNNTQPFSFPLHGKKIIFAHNGHVPTVTDASLRQLYHPLGSTDSEIIFSALLQVMTDNADRDFSTQVGLLERFLTDLSHLGPLNIIFSDSEYLYAFSNKRTQPDGVVRAPGMHYLCRYCSADSEAKLSGVTINGHQQNLILFASVPLSNENWVPMTPNTLYVAKAGELVQPLTTRTLPSVSPGQN